MEQHIFLEVTGNMNNEGLVNETDLADLTVLNDYPFGRDESEPDNLRILIPLDLNHRAIMRRLNDIYLRYGYPEESNECYYQQEVRRIITNLELYDQFWLQKHGDCGNGHSKYATDLAKDIIARLEEEEGCAELFPYDEIEELRTAYLGCA